MASEESSCGAVTSSTASTTIMNGGNVFEGEVITLSSKGHQSATVEDTKHRAVHQIKLSALRHNYNCVEAAASNQKCSVIVVVKADGYGHGATESAIHLADAVGADAFAVATLEEGIALRKALDATSSRAGRQASSASRSASQSSNNTTPGVSSLFTPPTTDKTPISSAPASINNEVPLNRRPAFVRILVLGPPVGYPRCFDDYYYYQIECMVSGPEMASAMLEWVNNPDERKKTLVERAAQESKLLATSRSKDDLNGDDETPAKQHAATLSNLTGQDLAKEVRQMLLNQQKNPKSTASANSKNPNSSNGNSGVATPVPGGAKSSFGGIEAAAKSSRSREKAVAQQVFHDDGTESVVTTSSPVKNLRKLRFHTLVDSGMGRLGFKTDYPLPNDARRDTVIILKELLEAEVNGAPLGESTLYFLDARVHVVDRTLTLVSQLSSFPLSLDQNSLVCAHTWRKQTLHQIIPIPKLSNSKAS